MKPHKFDIFSFSSLPFRNDSKAVYLDSSRGNVIKTMQNFLNYRGFAVLCGSPGTGKTMLLNHLCRKLNPNENKVIYIPFSMLKPSDMLKAVCVKLNIEPAVSTSKMLSKIQSCITDMQPVNVVMVFDEIQKISYQTMELIRLMTNINFEEKNLVSVIMAGNEEFIQQLKLRINESLRQRISCYCRIKPLMRTDTEQYIQCQLEKTGAHHEIITKQAVNAVHDLTSGVPRMINSLVFAALENAAENNSAVVDLQHINEAAILVVPPEMEVY